MSRYNEAKREILEALEDLGEATAEEVAGFLGRSHESVSMALLRYHRQGLVSRQTLEGRTKIYQLTQRGMERLWYLVEHASFTAM